MPKYELIKEKIDDSTVKYTVPSNGGGEETEIEFPKFAFAIIETDEGDGESYPCFYDKQEYLSDNNGEYVAVYKLLGIKKVKVHPSRVSFTD